MEFCSFVSHVSFSFQFNSVTFWKTIKHIVQSTAFISVHVCVYLCLCVGLQPEQAAHLSGLSVDDSSSNEVRRIRIHTVQQSYTETQQLEEWKQQNTEK